jgi:uncharacterized protein YecT (DUF1311 family)
MMSSRLSTRLRPRVTTATLLSLVGVYALGCSAAHAADCKSQDLNMMEMTQCADQRLKSTDAELNTVYAALMKKIEAPDQKRLRDAERAWIAFRDSECLFRIGGEDQGGTLWPMLELQCKADMTEARVKDLREQVKCPSFDLSCPAK